MVLDRANQGKQRPEWSLRGLRSDQFLQRRPAGLSARRTLSDESMGKETLEEEKYRYLGTCNRHQVNDALMLLLLMIDGSSSCVTRACMRFFVGNLVATSAFTFAAGSPKFG